MCSMSITYQTHVLGAGRGGLRTSLPKKHKPPPPKPGLSLPNQIQICHHIAQILFRQYPDIIQMLSRHCLDIGQLLSRYWLDSGQILSRYCLDNIQILSRYFRNHVQILTGCCLDIGWIFFLILSRCSLDIIQILSGYCLDFVQIFASYCPDIRWILVRYCLAIVVQTLSRYYLDIVQTLSRYWLAVVQILAGYRCDQVCQKKPGEVRERVLFVCQELHTAMCLICLS